MHIELDFLIELHWSHSIVFSSSFDLNFLLRRWRRRAIFVVLIYLYFNLYRVNCLLFLSQFQEWKNVLLEKTHEMAITTSIWRRSISNAAKLKLKYCVCWTPTMSLAEIAQFPCNDDTREKFLPWVRGGEQNKHAKCLYAW